MASTQGGAGLAISVMPGWPSGQRLPDPALERSQPGRHTRPQVNTQCAPLALHQHLEIAARLRGHDHAEAVLPAGDRDIGGGIAGDLQEYAAVRAALVGLAGRMQEAWAEPE